MALVASRRQDVRVLWLRFMDFGAGVLCKSSSSTTRRSFLRADDKNKRNRQPYTLNLKTLTKNREISLTRPS